MTKHATATGITDASARCMQAELDAKRRCIEEISALQPETPEEYRLKTDTLQSLRETVAKLEAQHAIMLIMASALGKAAARTESENK